jgi:hypothetical protein
MIAKSDIDGLILCHKDEGGADTTLFGQRHPKQIANRGKEIHLR